MSTVHSPTTVAAEQVGALSLLDSARSQARDWEESVAQLERAFGHSFTILDAGVGEVVRPVQHGLEPALSSYIGVCDSVARHGRPEIIEDVAPLALLAIPLPLADEECQLVAVGCFATQSVATRQEAAPAAQLLGLDCDEVIGWLAQAQSWSPTLLVRLAESVVENLARRRENTRLQQQVKDVSSHLLGTFEEVTLLHRLTQHLSLSGSVTELCELAAGWLSDVVPAECIAIKLDINSEDTASEIEGDVESVLITHGPCPVDDFTLGTFVERLCPASFHEPTMLQRGTGNQRKWDDARIREFISVPIREGDKHFGWLVALNHTGGRFTKHAEACFGTVEANLMSSVAVILGIHCGNLELYREQSDFFAGMVRAFTSAIDAKDPYTCGHSDRVAQLSVCLAREMGCTPEELNTIYLAGLLHDIGKIGIDDNVLRKPGQLTAEEFEHIKTHPQLGYKILDGVKQLEHILPIVLHHHEAWDGSGYPHGLAGEQCPKLARIVAVADSIDAMSSDRPYRNGMPDDKLDEILKNGAGQQWDARIVDAVFRVREEVRHIGLSDRAPHPLDVEKWHCQAT